jgi:hypothetical protein
VFGLRPWGPDYSLGKVQWLVGQVPFPMLFVTDDPLTARALLKQARDHPAGWVTVIYQPARR